MMEMKSEISDMVDYQRLSAELHLSTKKHCIAGIFRTHRDKENSKGHEFLFETDQKSLRNLS